jgi:hypothetical protein
LVQLYRIIYSRFKVVWCHQAQMVQTARPQRGRGLDLCVFFSLLVLAFSLPTPSSMNAFRLLYNNTIGAPVLTRYIPSPFLDPASPARLFSTPVPFSETEICAQLCTQKPRCVAFVHGVGNGGDGLCVGLAALTASSSSSIQSLTFIATSASVCLSTCLTYASSIFMTCTWMALNRLEISLHR